VDRTNGNTPILTATAATTTQTTAAIDNPSNLGVIVFVDLTTQAGAETVTPSIEIFDQASGKWIAYVSYTAISATGSYAKILYPGALTADGVATRTETKTLPLPRNWRIKTTHSSTGAHTYTVGYAYLI
jgi:hypothetical protein